jgi:hypothetical protein
MTARELEIIALAHASTTEAVKRRALEVLGDHAAVISEARMSAHREVRPRERSPWHGTPELRHLERF